VTPSLFSVKRVQEGKSFCRLDSR